MTSRCVLYILVLAIAIAIFGMLVGSILLLQSSFPYASRDQSLNLNNNTKTATKENITHKLENPIYCDRNSSYKSDVCFMRGDVRIDSLSSTISVVLHDSYYSKDILGTEELIRPYPRKWETGIMATVEELKLVNMLAHEGGGPICDVRHNVPAVVFYAGGYTGNLYHEFNDGIVPLYITSQHFNKKVVFVILKYRVWWINKYKDILSQLSDYPPIDFSGDKRIHCFPEVNVGLRIHDELSIDPSKMQGNKSIHDFHSLLDRAYRPKIHQPTTGTPLPRLLILSRNGSRRIENEKNLIRLCEKLKFQVRTLSPEPTTLLGEMYESLVSTEVMIGVHGAALTHFLFMRPGSVLVQIVPLGNGWAAETCFGKPTKRMSLKYMKYDILPKESSLYQKYEREDPVLQRPDEVAKKGWEVTKKLYLEGQSVTLDLERFGKLLVEAYEYSLTRN